MGGVLKVSEFLKKLSEIFDLGKEFYDTLKFRTKLSTLFDIYSEKVIPSFVSEKDLKEYYEKRMEEINKFIISL